MTTFWNPTSYGFAPVYFLTVSGIPVVFTERALGLTLPSGWGLEDAALVIDDSSDVGTEAIDRDRGVGVGLDLSFKLLDTDVVRDWLRRWSKSATLTQDFLAGDTTIHVDDTSAWAGSGIVYIGLERIQYNGKTGTTFTTLTRATCGSLESSHKIGTTSQIVTDRPRFWRGRDLTLWAIQADPSGHVCGSALIGQEATQIWRGRVTGGPDRSPDGFLFTAQSLDRVLDQPLGAKVSGKVANTGGVYEVNPGWTMSVTLDAMDTTAVSGSVFLYEVTIAPFDGLAAGTLLSASAIRDALRDAWAAEVTLQAIGADVGDLVHQEATGGVWNMAVSIPGNVNTRKISWTVKQNWQLIGQGQQTYSNGQSAAVTYQYVLGKSAYDPQIPADAPVKNITLDLTEGNATDVPTTGGMVRLKNGDVSCTYSYTKATVDQSAVHLTGLTPLPPSKGFTTAQALDADAAILFDDTGPWGDLVLRCLTSSGTGLRSVSWDILPQGQGYGISEDLIESDQVASKMASGTSLVPQGKVSVAGSSFVDAFGGVLALFRRAVVARPNANESNTPIRLTIVETGPGTNYATTITDADLLTHQGDPVANVHRAESPTAVTIECPSVADGDSATETVVFNDNAAIEAVGRIEVTYKVPATDVAKLKVAAGKAVVAHFANDQTLQAVELKVHPSVQAEVGDALWLSTTHPAVWTWSTTPGQVGYDGPGRVVGRKMSLATCTVTLTVLIDGSTRVHALSPAAEVLAYGGLASAPTWIEVDLSYKPHFETAIAEAGAAVRVLHYQPGQAEGSGQKYSISAAATVAGVCRLTVSAQVGVFSLDLTKRSTLTLPLTADVTTYQGLFAHADDGTIWS